MIEDNYWWTRSSKDIHGTLFQYLDNLETQQSYRHMENLKHMQLYGNYGVLGFQYSNYAAQIEDSAIQNRVTMNIIQSMIDTVVSKITKNKPKPTFLTDGGDWSLQSKAKKLTKFCEGLFNSTDLYKESVRSFTDSCIFGTGAIKVYKQDGEIKVERVLIDELKVDDSESLYGKPRQMHQVKYIHKDVLKAMFPSFQFELENETDSSNFSSSTYKNKDMIRVVESWRLPSGKKSNDGLHTICVRSATLFSEPYTKTYFPFIVLRWTERPMGFFGQGLAEQLAGIQLEINKILRTIQISMHLTCIPKVFVEASSKVVTAHINSKIGGIIKYAGTKPSYESVGAIAPELFSHLDRLYNRAYEIAGVSQLSARSLKPAGLDSGKALREFNDIESERFLDVAKRYEDFFIECAEVMIDMARDLYADGEEVKVKVKGRKFIETIDWSEVDLDEDKYMMTCFPTSSLASSPAARLQDVQELLQAGFIAKEDGLKLLDFPDLEAHNSLLTADIDNIDRQIELMVHKQQYETPEPYQNLELCLRKAQQAYLKYKQYNAPEESLELLRRYMEDAQDLIIKSQPPQTPVAPPMPETPSQDIAALADQMDMEQNPVLGAPAPAPESDLLPQQGVTAPPLV